MSQKSFRSFAFLLLLTSATALIAQDQPAEASAPTTSTSLPLTTTLPKDFPVITAETPCPKSAAKPACKMVVTRQEFESLVDALNPRMIKPERHELAESYGRILALSQQAIQKGLDRDPEVQAQLKYQRLHALAIAMAREIYKDAQDSPSGDAEQYYQAHKSLFERYSFERLFIPKQKRGEAPKNADFQTALQQANEALPDPELKALADQMYARAEAGEDFLKLQKEVFQQTGITSDPDVKVNDLRRGDLSETQNVAFELAPGKMTPVIADYSGYFIYKLVSRVVPPFNEVKPQVVVRMENDKQTQAVKNIEKQYKAKINQAYFDKYDPPPPDPNAPEMDND